MAELFSWSALIALVALSVLLLIGMIVVAEGFGQHIPRGYVYFAMGLSIFVEMLEIKARSRREPKSDGQESTHR